MSDMQACQGLARLENTDELEKYGGWSGVGNRIKGGMQCICRACRKEEQQGWSGGVENCGVHMRSEITYRRGVTIYRAWYCMGRVLMEGNEIRKRY